MVKALFFIKVSVFYSFLCLGLLDFPLFHQLLSCLPQARHSPLLALSEASEALGSSLKVKVVLDGLMVLMPLLYFEVVIPGQLLYILHVADSQVIARLHFLIVVDDAIDDVLFRCLYS